MIANLTQHAPTPEQALAGLQAPLPGASFHLNFATMPHPWQIWDAARSLAGLASESGAKKALIGGFPALMGPLEQALRAEGITPLYAFSERVSTEETLPDGSVKKSSVFRHVGFFPGATVCG